ncbi:MAG: hypothetical protein EZS28_048540 [Streblomastix strix]|uniref:HNH nuclease domain-containing protein n=1 Tax=Streblomastix strix TaxID=222440 RepID=A0A5J4TDU4_9EUKA|nr:MAG: hypothetical protein EZS28_048540 [Streblomastix strix]
MNQIKTDNRLENLRWVSHSDNQKNKLGYRTKFEYFDELPEGSQRLDMYSGHDLEGYSFDQDFNIIRGIKTFLQPIIAGKIIKQGGTSNQILLANGDTIEKDQLDYEPIENARFSSIAYGMYESRIWGTVTT